MSRRDETDAVWIYFFLGIFVFVLGYANYKYAMAKCEKAGRSPASCAEFLR